LNWATFNTVKYQNFDENAKPLPVESQATENITHSNFRETKDFESPENNKSAVNSNYNESKNNSNNSKTNNDSKYYNYLLYGGLIVGAVGLAPIMFGFGTAGVAAGSLAAGTQSTIGAVSAGSWFATVTSLGMKGVFVKTAVAGGVSTGVAATSKGYNYFKKQDSNLVQENSSSELTEEKSDMKPKF
jgi:hypothetical protein